MNNKLSTIDFYKKYVRLNFIYYIEMVRNFTSIEVTETNMILSSDTEDEVDSNPLELIFNLCKEATIILEDIENLGNDAVERANSDPEFKKMLSKRMMQYASELSSRAHMVYENFYRIRLIWYENMADNEYEENPDIHSAIEDKIKKYESMSMSELGDALIKAQELAHDAAKNADMAFSKLLDDDSDE